MASTETTTFQYIQENSDAFLALFPHRYDFIYAPHPDPKQKPDWQSESRYPLSDRQLLKGDYLYGVRFEKETQYCLLDIDNHSPYHPKQAPLAIERLLETLEPLGIADHILCTSSDSQGLHIYLPISKAFNSWKLAKAISIALEQAGFKLKLGQLELFPNPRAYQANEKPSLFNAHRLPLQIGSYILNQDFLPISSSQQHFVRMWKLCQRRNSLSKRRITALIKQSQQLSYKLSNKAAKFLSDLNTEIEEGWTDHGQTNRLLGRITMRSFIFNHITEGGEPLYGQMLINRIVDVAKALPGYKDWCQHTHEIEDRAAEWTRCIENSRYFPYGTAQGMYKKLNSTSEVKLPDWNQLKAKETQAKIIAAVKDLEETKKLPEKATARFKALLEYNIGGASLYRYRELWHPIDFKNIEEESGLLNSVCGDASARGANVPTNPASLLPAVDSNELENKDLGDLRDEVSEPEGNNSSESPQVIRDRIRKQLADAQAAREKANEDVVQPVLDGMARAIHLRAVQRMREFLLSGEPILLAEVGQWLTKQPLTVHDELVGQGTQDEQALLRDLRVISIHLVRVRLSPWELHFQLEERFGKALLLDLSEAERRAWIDALELRSIT
ncbi:MAG: hypothetical protein AB8B99_22800 [Phormidesmis sp.]